MCLSWPSKIHAQRQVMVWCFISRHSFPRFFFTPHFYSFIYLLYFINLWLCRFFLFFFVNPILFCIAFLPGVFMKNVSPSRNHPIHTYYTPKESPTRGLPVHVCCVYVAQVCATRAAKELPLTPSDNIDQSVSFSGNNDNTRRPFSYPRHL